jgi:hypothetical protein
MGRKVESIELFSGMSVTQLARLTGLSRETIARRIEDAQLKPSGERQGHPIFKPRDALPAIFAMTGDEMDPDKLKPFERHAHWKAEREKLHLQIERADVVVSLDVEQRYASRNKLIDQAVETAPDVLERDVGLTAIQAKRLEKHLDELRLALHRILVEDDAAGAV